MEKYTNVNRGKIKRKKGKRKKEVDRKGSRFPVWWKGGFLSPVGSRPGSQWKEVQLASRQERFQVFGVLVRPVGWVLQ